MKLKELEEKLRLLNFHREQLNHCDIALYYGAKDSSWEWSGKPLCYWEGKYRGHEFALCELEELDICIQ